MPSPTTWFSWREISARLWTMWTKYIHCHTQSSMVTNMCLFWITHPARKLDALSKRVMVYFHFLKHIYCIYLTYLLNRLFAIKTWWLEKEHFKYGAHAYNNLTAVGHYTQLVWAATHRVGCGLNTCKMRQNGKVLPYYTYICNYCPMWV